MSVKTSRSHDVSVSVIVPMLDAERFIAECLESVLAQTMTDFELLVVDDGCTDGSSAIVEEYAAGDSRIRLFCHPGGTNRGVSLSRQLAFDNARGEYVAMLDADDTFEPLKLERQLEELGNRPECVLSHTGIKVHREAELESAGMGKWTARGLDFLTERHFRLKRSVAEVYQLLDRPDAFSRNYILNSTVMIRTSILEEIRFGYSQLFQIEDWTLFIRLALKGPFLVLPDQLTRWRQHPEQSTRQTESDRLKVAYRKLEFLLYLLATVEDPRVQGPVKAALPAALQDAAGCYAEPSERAIWESEPLELERLSPLQHRWRRYWNTFLKKGRTLFGR